MALGAVQKVVICAPVSGAGASPCASGFEPQVIDAYVLVPGASSWVETSSAPFDLNLAGALWGAFFGAVFLIYFMSLFIRQVLNQVPRR